MAIKTVAVLLATYIVFVSSHPGYESAPMPYQFAYDVNDPFQGLSFDHQENSDGNVVTGFYNVALPDGRQKNVEYRADHQTGFVAKVNYEGQAQHPQVYAPAITFRPSQNNLGQGQGGSGFGYGGQGSGNDGFVFGQGHGNGGFGFGQGQGNGNGGGGFGYGSQGNGNGGGGYGQGGQGNGNGAFGFGQGGQGSGKGNDKNGEYEY